MGGCLVRGSVWQGAGGRSDGQSGGIGGCKCGGLTGDRPWIQPVHVGPSSGPISQAEQLGNQAIFGREWTRV